MSQRHHAAPCKLYIHPRAVALPQLPLIPKSRVSCPSWGWRGGSLHLEGPTGAGPRWPPRMLRAACLSDDGTAECCGKHEKISNKAELTGELKGIHTENVACPKLPESQPLMWESPRCPQKSLGPQVFSLVSPVRSLLPPRPTSFMAVHPPCCPLGAPSTN